MECGDQVKFATKDEEVLYWKDFAERLMDEKDNVQKEFDDYTSDSQQLEKEYEATIEQNERTIKELRLSQNRVQNELESLRLKLEQMNHENIALESESIILKRDGMKLQKYIRELEQKNDDLERAERMGAETAAAYKASLHTEIEKNAMLESEVGETETLKEKLQRLADETRDLKQELHVKERCPDNERVPLLNGVSPTNGEAPSIIPTTNGHVVDSNRLKETETQTSPKKRDPQLSPDNRPLTPSSRVLALNLIGELMRKVGVLEAKLGLLRHEHISTESIRRRHNSRGRTSPSLQTLK